MFIKALQFFAVSVICVAISALLFVMAIDALEVERTGECKNCVLLSNTTDQK